MLNSSYHIEEDCAVYAVDILIMVKGVFIWKVLGGGAENGGQARTEFMWPP